MHSLFLADTANVLLDIGDALLSHVQWRHGNVTMKPMQEEYNTSCFKTCPQA